MVLPGRRLSFRRASGNGSQKDVQFLKNLLSSGMHNVVVADVSQRDPAFADPTVRFVTGRIEQSFSEHLVDNLISIPMQMNER